jgi:flagellar FliL protein
VTNKLKKYVLLLLALGAVGAFSLAPSAALAAEKAEAAKAEKKDAKKEEKKDEKKDAKKDKGDSDITGGKFDGDPIYVHLQPLLLPVISDQGAEQIVTILIDVQVKDMRIADDMHSNMPRVKSAVFEALYGGLGDGSLRVGSSINLPKVKTQIATTLGKTMGADKINDVLIQAIAQRLL